MFALQVSVAINANVVTLEIQPKLPTVPYEYYNIPPQDTKAADEAPEVEKKQSHTGHVVVYGKRKRKK